MNTTSPLFSLGQTFIIPCAKEELERLQTSQITLFKRHITGDWSEMDVEDRQSNKEAVEGCLRVFSVYTIQGIKALNFG